MEKKLNFNTILLLIIAALLVVGIFVFIRNANHNTTIAYIPQNNQTEDVQDNSSISHDSNSVNTSTSPVYSQNTPDAKYISYIDSQYNFSLRYNSSKPFGGDKPFSVDVVGVQSVYVCIKDGYNYSGNPDELKQMGFSDLSGCEYRKYGLANSMPTVDSIAQEEITNHNQPFGSNPTITSATLSGQPAKIVSGNSQVAFFIRLPQPIVQRDGNTWYILTMYTSEPFVEDIISSFKFNI